MFGPWIYLLDVHVPHGCSNVHLLLFVHFPQLVQLLLHPDLVGLHLLLLDLLHVDVGLRPLGGHLPALQAHLEPQLLLLLIDIALDVGILLPFLVQVINLLLQLVLKLFDLLFKVLESKIPEWSGWFC